MIKRALTQEERKERSYRLKFLAGIIISAFILGFSGLFLSSNLGSDFITSNVVYNPTITADINQFFPTGSEIEIAGSRTPITGELTKGTFNGNEVDGYYIAQLNLNLEGYGLKQGRHTLNVFYQGSIIYTKDIEITRKEKQEKQPAEEQIQQPENAQQPVVISNEPVPEVPQYVAPAQHKIKKNVDSVQIAKSRFEKSSEGFVFSEEKKAKKSGSLIFSSESKKQETLQIYAKAVTNGKNVRNVFTSTIDDEGSRVRFGFIANNSEIMDSVYYELKFDFPVTETSTGFIQQLNAEEYDFTGLGFTPTQRIFDFSDVLAKNKDLGARIEKVDDSTYKVICAENVAYADCDPTIAFVSPTPSGTTIYWLANAYYVNISSNNTYDLGDHYTLLDWNRSLVLWMRFENQTGLENATYFMDESSWSNNGTCATATCPTLNTTAGKFGNAETFNSQYINSPASESLNITTNTISFGGWVYPTVSNVYQTIIKYGDAGTSRQYALYLSSGGTSAIYWSLNGVSNGNIAVSPAWSTNAWNHIFLVYNSTRVIIYINGVNAYTIDSVVTANIATIANSKLWIGEENAAQFPLVNGNIDDIQIYNRALTPQEINASYNATKYQYYNNFTGLVNGNSYTYQGYSVNGSGNMTSTAQSTVTIDTTIPLINFTYPTEDNDSTLTRSNAVINVSVTETNLANVTYYLYTTTTLVNSTNKSSADFMINITNLANSVYYFNATVWDLAGNRNATETRTITISASSPSSQINFTYPTENNNSYLARNNTQINITFSATDGVKNATIWLWNTTSLVNNTNSTTSSFFMNITNLIDGNYTFNASVEDVSGNVNWTEKRYVWIDTAAPQIAYGLGTEANYSYLNRNWTIVNVTASDIYLLNATIWLYNTTSLVNTTNFTTASLWLNFTNLPNEHYYFNATASDLAGNKNQTSTYQIWIDTVFPQINFTFPTPDTGIYRNYNQAYINVSSSDLNQHYTILDWNRSLLLWMRFENQTGENATYFMDESTYSNNGTCSIYNKCPTYNSTGRFGSAYYFNANQYPAVKLTTTPPGTQKNKTFSAWVYPNDPAPGTSNPYCVFGYYNLCVYHGVLWHHTGLEACFSNTNVPMGTWSHIAIVQNDTKLVFYINGTRDTATCTATGGTITDSVGATSNEGAYGFNGSIDEVMVFSRPFSQEEISALYNATAYQYYNNFTSLAEGNYTYQAYSVDQASNKNSTEQRTIIIDTSPETIAYGIGTETNYSYLNRNFTIINVTSTDTNIANISINIYNTTSLVNSSNSTASSYWVNITNLIDGAYTFNATIYDSWGRTNSTSTYQIWIDTVYPQINFTFPTPDTGVYRNYNQVYINVSSSDLNQHYTILDWNRSLIAWFRFENKTGLENATYLMDESTWSINATGTPKIAYRSSCKFGNCWDFRPTIIDGSTANYITLPATKVNMSQREMTIMAWVRPEQSTMDVTISYWYITSAYPSAYISMGIGSGGKLFAIITNNSGTGTTLLSPSATANTWYHVALTKNSNETWTFWFNGVAMGNWTSNTTATSTYPNRIGSLSSSWPWNGSIDEFQAYSRALSPSEINASYNATAYQYYHNFTSLNDAPYTYQAYSVDQASNKNQTETRNVTIDTTFPSINFTYPTENNNSYLARNNTQINITFSDANGIKNATIYLWNTTSLVNATNSTTSSFFMNITGLPDMAYTFNASAEDLAGNINWTETRTVTILTTNSMAINFTNPTENNNTYLSRNNTMINVTVVGINLANITIWLYNTTALVNATNSTTSPNFVNITNLPDSNYTFNASVVDLAGNINWTETRNIWIDTTPPQINFTFPTDDNASILTTRADIVVNLSVVEPNMANVSINIYNTTSLVNSTNFTAYPYLLNVTGLRAGTYYVNATAIDLAGNKNATETRTITINALASCQHLVTQNTTYYLINNVMTTATGDCFNITASNITLQGNGYSINSSTSGNGYGVIAIGTNTTNLANLDIRNVTIWGKYVGIYLVYVNNSIIQNVTFYNHSYAGVFAVNSVYNTIINNNAYGNDGGTYNPGMYGFILSYSPNNNISSNNAYNMSCGFYTQWDYNNTFTANTAYNHTYHGFLFDYASNTTYQNNIAYKNGQRGFYSDESADFYGTAGNNTGNKYINNTAYSNGDYGFLVNGYFGSRIVFINNTAYSNSQSGFQLNGVERCNMTSNTARNGNSGGFSFENIQNCTFIGNNATSDNAGFRIFGSASRNNVFTNNIAASSWERSGFWIDQGASDNSFSYNIIRSNALHGIYLDTANRNYFFNNTITESGGSGTRGIKISNSNSNIFVNNLISTHSSTLAVQLDTNTNNNTFINETIISDYNPFEILDKNNNFTIKDSILNATYSADLYIESDVTGGSWNFTNVTKQNGTVFSKTWESGANGTLNLHWYLDANATYASNNTLVNSANISAADVFGATWFNVLTNASGSMPQQILLEYQQNETTTTYYSNYTVTGHVSNLYRRIESWNMTLNRFITVDLDDIIPTAINFTYPTENNNSYLARNNTMINVTATDTYLANITIWLYNTTSLVNTTNSSTSPNFANITNLRDGNYTFNASVVDIGGNINWTETRNIWIDTTYPLINFTFPTENNATYLARNNTMINITFSDANGIKNATIYLYNSTTLINATNSTTSPFFMNITNLRDGIYYFNATAYDLAGNINWTETRKIWIDTTKPLINFTYPTENNNSYLTRNNTVINVSITETNLANVTYYLYNTTTLVNSTNKSSADFIINITDLLDGLYYFNATAYDLAGNRNATETRTITIDTILPYITLITPNSDAGSNNGNITFNYNVTDTNNVINCSLVFNGIINQTNTTITKATTINFTLNNLASNTYNWTVNCTDSANNMNAAAERRIAVIKTTSFSGRTTDLSQVNISNIPNLIIENPSYGIINYSESVDLSGGADLDANINISSNKIEVNSTAIQSINKSATLMLYNLTFSNPRILRDVSVCPSAVCTKIGYTASVSGYGSNLTFNVMQFTSYSAAETPTPPTPGTSGGSGGGGGVPVPKENKTEPVIIEQPPIKVAQSSINTKGTVGIISYSQITVSNPADVPVTVTLSTENLGSIVKFNKQTFKLGPGDGETIEFSLTPPKEPGVYAGKIIVSSSNNIIEIPIAFNVKSEKSLFDISVDIADDYKLIRSGDKLTSQITLIQMGKQELVDVTVNYFIKDFNNKIYMKESETLAVDKEKTYNKEFNTQNLPLGQYLIGAEVVYGSSIATASSQFNIIESKKTEAKNYFLIGVIIFAVLGVLALLATVIYHNRKLYIRNNMYKNNLSAGKKTIKKRQRDE